MRGALVQQASPPRVVRFQFNPRTLNRSLTPAGAADAGGDGPTLPGPPVETLSFEAELDATDALGAGDPNVEKRGLHGQLALLELLLYPDLQDYAVSLAARSAGVLELAPIGRPPLLFVWGERRVLPVYLESLSVVEEAWDANLNPTRARASFGLRVLRPSDVGASDPVNGLFLAHQARLEAFAATVVDNSGGGR